MEFRQPSRKADGGRFLFLISVFVVIYNWRKYVDANGDQAAGTIVEKRESVSIHTDVWYRRFEVIRDEDPSSLTKCRWPGMDQSLHFSERGMHPGEYLTFAAADRFNLRAQRWNCMRKNRPPSI
jgi:hypothetical protein